MINRRKIINKYKQTKLQPSAATLGFRLGNLSLMFHLSVQVLFKTSFTPNRLNDVAIK